MDERDAGELAGTVLSHYRLIERLGAGGMGVVYRAHDTELDRDVAIKLLPPDLTADPRARAALLREARLASQLNHPHICTIHEVGQAGERVFVAMELVAGKPLRDLIPADGLADETVARYGAQIARALAHAHAAGVVHRDLKTANIVVGPGGQAKLLDFGLSRPVGEEAAGGTMTSTGVVAGTPQYLAPEVLLGGRAGVASDIWALGVVLHEMGSGQLPFSSGHVGVAVTAILHASPAPLPARVDPGLRSVVARCLAKDPRQRYQHADEVAAALEALFPGTAPETPAARGHGRRRRARLASVVALALIAAAATAWHFWGPGSGRRVPPERTVMILPLEVRGQVEGARFAGRAFAEALAVNLAQSRNIRVMPVPAGTEASPSAMLGRAPAAWLSGAGRLVIGALTRDGDSLRASVSLVDTRANQLLWGEERAVSGGDLPLLASSLAPRIAEQLGATPAKRYDYFMYVTGPPEMATSPELTEALGAVRRYELPRSLEATRRLVERFPEQPDAHVLRAAALMFAARTEPADSPAGRALAAGMETLHRLDPANPWYDVGRALRMRPGEGDPARSLTRVLSRRDLTPAARGAVLAIRADILGGVVGDTVAALADAGEAIRLDPASDLSLSTLARWLSRRGRYAEAAQRVRQAVALNPTVPDYWHQLGNCMLKLGRWDEYAADLDRAAGLAPDPGAVLSAQCDGLSSAGRYREASGAARRALALRPERWLYRLQLGLCLMRQGQWREATSLLERACREGGAAGCDLHAAAAAVALVRAGDEAGAREQARRAGAAPASKSHDYALACYHALQGEREEALRLLEGSRAQRWVEPELARDPNLASLRDDPRFRRLASWMDSQPIDRVLAEWGRSR